jgi:hypothetical protein
MSVFRYNASRILKIVGAHRPGEEPLCCYICLSPNFNNWDCVRTAQFFDDLRMMGEDIPS